MDDKPPPSYANASGVQQAQPPPAGFTVSSQPTAVVLTTTTQLGRVSMVIICPHCQQQIQTETKTVPSTMACCAGIVLALLGCWCGCCLIPCCMDDLQDVEHSCPNCESQIGRYRR